MWWTEKDVCSVRYNVPVQVYDMLEASNFFPEGMALEDRFIYLDQIYRPEVDKEDFSGIIGDVGEKSNVEVAVPINY